VLVVAPGLGDRAAELLEMPVMLAVSALAARWVAARLAVPSAASPRLAMGALALALMLAAEFGLVLQLRGMTVAEYLATRDPVAGAAYYASLLAFALLPWWLGRREARRAADR
jgi:hypothetical protein